MVQICEKNLTRTGILCDFFSFVHNHQNIESGRNENEFIFYSNVSNLSEIIQNFAYDDFDISTATITSNGKIYRPAREMTAGIPISLLRKEYIGEYSSYVIDNYEHNCPADFSTLAADTVFNTRPRHLSIESNILLEDEEELLLEDGTTNSPNSSAIGKILADDGLSLIHI